MPTPTPNSAPSSGAPMAMTEPNAIRSTATATARPTSSAGSSLFGLCPLDDLAAEADLEASLAGGITGGEQIVDLLRCDLSGAAVVEDLCVRHGAVR